MIEIMVIYLFIYCFHLMVCLCSVTSQLLMIPLAKYYYVDVYSVCLFCGNSVVTILDYLRVSEILFQCITCFEVSFHSCFVWNIW